MPAVKASLRNMKGRDTRAQILDAATEGFLADGYGATSMQAIAVRAGVSKQTVYSHFGAKEALFEAIIQDQCERLMQPFADVADDHDDPAGLLFAVAHHFMEMLAKPDAIGRLRLVVSESHRFPELAKAFYRAGPQVFIRRLADYLADQNRLGRLAVADPDLAAGQLLGAVRGDLHFRILLGLEGAPTEAELIRHVRHAVDCFLRAHRID